MENKLSGSTPIWEAAAEYGKKALKLVNGDTGLMFIEQDGAVAAILLGENSETVKKSLKLFQQRINEMMKHIESGKMDLSDDKKYYVRDNKTGEYGEAFDPPGGSSRNN
jgi:hypothetical protein